MTDKPSQPARSPLKGCLTILGIAAAAAIAFVACNAIVYRDDEGSSGDRARAIYACEDAIGDQLRAPSTGNFESRIQGEDGTRFTVAGEVEAENALGGTVRALYECQVRVTDGGASVVSAELTE